MAGDKKVLIVSLGSIGKRHLRNTRKLIPDAKIAVYRQYTRDDKIIPKDADYIFFHLDEAISFKPNVCIIASPASEHINNSKVFLDNGAHLFIEKPLATHSSDIKSFVNIAKSSSLFMMVGYVLRFLPALQKIRELLSNQIIGQVRTAHIQVGQYLPDWRPSQDYRKGVSAQASLGGGALLELSHELDYAVWLFGQPDSLQCSKAKLSDLDIDVEDYANVIFEYTKYDSKRRVIVQLDFLQRVANMSIQIVGSLATLKANLITEDIYIYTPDNPGGEYINIEKSINGNEPYLRQFDFLFSKCFNNYKPVYNQTPLFTDWVTVKHASKVLRLVDLAKYADEKGCRIPFK